MTFEFSQVGSIKFILFYLEGFRKRVYGLMVLFSRQMVLESEPHLQSVGHGQTHQARVQVVLPCHSKQSGEQHDAVSDELDADSEPPV